MKSQKHTPGPWRWTAVSGGWDGVEQENGPLICKLVLNEPENARLIAAAPELLECLQGLLLLVNEVTNDGGEAAEIADSALAAAASKAINKATGGES